MAFNVPAWGSAPHGFAGLGSTPGNRSRREKKVNGRAAGPREPRKVPNKIEFSSHLSRLKIDHGF